MKVSPDMLQLKFNVDSQSLYICFKVVCEPNTFTHVTDPHITLFYKLACDDWTSFWQAKHSACSLLASRTCRLLLKGGGGPRLRSSWILDPRCEAAVPMEMLRSSFLKANNAVDMDAATPWNLHISWRALCEFEDKQPETTSSRTL